MKRSRRLLAIFFFLFAQLLLAGESKLGQGRAILDERGKHSLNAPAASPYVLEATFTFTRFHAPPVPGTYKLTWVSSDRWRRDIDVGNLQEILIRSKNKIWTQRSVDVQPLLDARLNEAIGYLQELGVNADDKIVKVSNKKRDGAVLNCVETQAPVSTGPARTFCIHEDTAALSSVQVGLWSYEYSPSQLPGQKPVPETIRVSNEGKAMIDIHLTRISEPQAATDILFAPPPHAEEWVTCDKPVHETYALRVPPHYPEKERQEHHEGTVVMYGVVTTDGSIERLKVIESSGALFDREAMNAVKQWKYHPPTCDGIAFRKEVEVQINFALSR